LPATSPSFQQLVAEHLRSTEFRLFADGKPVLEGTSIATAGFRKETLQIDPSGALLILSQDATSFTRFSITPSPETSVATMFGGAPGLAAKP
jgi:hypothetical protein